MLSVEVHDSFAKLIDNAVRKSGLYSSRSEFLKDSIRKNLLETLVLDDDFRKVHEAGEKIRDEIKRNEVKIRPLSRKERKQIADEFLKELQTKSAGSKT